MAPPEDTPETKPTIVSPVIQQIKNPSIFRGEDGQDPSKWLKEYERVATYNKWDDLISLANVYFFLDGTARQWFENNEEQITSWSQFKSELGKIFGDCKQTKRRAEEELKSRAQRQGESVQSYIQSVLGLCQEINPNMPEDEKISHLMKGVAEDVYQALLTKEMTTVGDFIKWCRHIEEMKLKRVSQKRFDRLPNVVPVASLSEDRDLAMLIRQVVREEVQSLLAKNQEPFNQVQSIEAMVREEMQDALSSLTNPQNQWTEVQEPPRRRRLYSTAAKEQRPVAVPQLRKTDIWRTQDNRPVCFHCGRPGHVARYCRERRAIFDAYRTSQRIADNQRSEIGESSDYSRTVARAVSPSPSRGRSPTRRHRSPSPYRRSSASPGRRNEEN